jgi:hypothetical protein cdiviTM7_00850
MIGEATTREPSPAGIDGDGFDVFSSLRDGAGGEDFSSGISEAVANDASQLDLVAVAGGEAELDVAISDNDTKEDCTPINPEFCRNFGSAACFGCVNLGLCQDRQAAMEKETKSQEGVETIRDRLLAPDSIDDLDEDGRGELVLPSPVRLYDQRNTEETSETPIETGHVDVVSKVANETGEAADDSGRVDLELKAIHNNLNVLPEKNVQSQSKPMDISPQEIETKSVDDDNSPIVEQGEMSAGYRLSAVDETITTRTPQDKLLENMQPPHSWSEKAVANESATLSCEVNQASDRSNKANYRGASGIQSSNSEQNTNVSLRGRLAQRVKKERSLPTGDVINAVPEEASSKRKKAIDIDLPIDFVAINDIKIKHNLPQKTKSEPLVNHADIKSQIPTAGDVCCNDVVEHADDKGEIWAEDEAVVLARQQESPTADMKPVSTEKALVGPPTEISDLREEIEGLYEVIEAEPVVVRTDSAGILAYGTAVDCDDEPVERLPIASEMPTAEETDYIVDEVIVAISKERETSRKKCETVMIKSPESGPSPVKEEVLLDEFSGLELIIGMTEERKVNVADKEVLEAEMVDGELLRQDYLVMDEGDVTQTYTGETIVDGDIPATDVRPLSGLWTDDSRLNPEEESASTAQSSADKTLLVSQLFGMLVVAMCVVCGRQARAIPNS